MTVEAGASEFVYIGDGVTTTFPFPSRFLEAGDIAVGVGYVEQTSGYTVLGAGAESGGAVVFSAAPPAGAQVALLCRTSPSQLVDFVNGQTVLEGVLNNALDRRALVEQYLLRCVRRSLRLADFDPGLMPELPGAADRAGKLVGFNQGGALSLFNGAGSVEDMATAIADAQAAADGANSAMSDAVAAASEASAALTLVNARWLGAYASRPAASPDGGPLIVGALGFNTTTGRLETYVGAGAWQTQNTSGLTNGPPSPSAGVDGDTKIDAAAGVLYTKAAGAWTGSSIVGPAGSVATATVTTISGLPAAAAGAMRFLTDGRKPGEAAGAGTGMLAVSQADEWLYADGRYMIDLQGETTALLAAMTSQPNRQRQRLIDTAIGALKTAGIWTKLDALQVYAAHHEQAGRVDWKLPSRVASRTETLTFTADRGFAGDGVSGKLDTGFNPAAGTPVSSLDSACMAIWQNGTANIAGYVNWTKESGNQSLLTPVGASTSVYWALNRPASTNTSTFPNLQGFFAANRSAAAAEEAYHNGIAIASAAVASSAIPNKSIWLGGWRNTDTLSSPTTRQFSAFAYGSSLTAEEQATLYATLKTYMVAVGNCHPDAVCWGDSLTLGPGGTSPYPTKLQQVYSPERITYNRGVSGETSTQIAARQEAEAARLNDVAIIWAGRNNFSPAGGVTTVQTDIAAMVGRQTSGKYLVLGIIAGELALEYYGGTERAKIDALNSALASTYGTRFVNTLDALLAAYNPADPQDVIDHGHGIVPASLRLTGDYLHLNDAGRVVIRDIVKQKLDAFGW